MEEVMSESMEREVEIRNKYGLHARPATQFVEMANQYPCEVVLVKDGEEVNGKSVMGLMMLGAECGARFRIRRRIVGQPDAQVDVRPVDLPVGKRFEIDADASPLLQVRYVVFPDRDL